MAAPRRRVGSRGLWIGLGFVGLAAIGLQLAGTERGQAFLVRYGVTRAFAPALATRLDVALARRFLELGLLRADVRARAITEAGHALREYSFAAPRHLTPTQCQVEIQQAARDAGAAVVRAELQHRKGEELVLWLGFGRTVTHRILVRRAPPAPPARPAPARIALILDDLGHNLNATTRGILDLGIPITASVLPDLPRSKAAFAAARGRGLPVLLHLPMQPDGGEDPGKDPIRVGMQAAAIEAIVERHHRRYGPFLGVNNHMGSRATADRPTMEALVRALGARDLVFVDSQTTPRSVGARVAREAGVWCASNDLFLDDKAGSFDEVAANLERLAGLARRRGLAVGIAHPKRHTLEALRALVPRLRAEGIEFVGLDGLRPGARVAAQPAP